MVTTDTLQMMPPPPRVKQPPMVLPGSVGWGLERTCQGWTMLEALSWDRPNSWMQGLVPI